MKLPVRYQYDEDSGNHLIVDADNVILSPQVIADAINGARPAERVAQLEQENAELRKAIAASCDEDRAEILSRGHGGCPLLAPSATETKK